MLPRQSGRHKASVALRASSVVESGDSASRTIRSAGALRPRQPRPARQPPKLPESPGTDNGRSFTSSIAFHALGCAGSKREPGRLPWPRNEAAAPCAPSHAPWSCRPICFPVFSNALIANLVGEKTDKRMIQPQMHADGPSGTTKLAAHFVLPGWAGSLKRHGPSACICAHLRLKFLASLNRHRVRQPNSALRRRRTRCGSSEPARIARRTNGRRVKRVRRRRCHSVEGMTAAGRTPRPRRAPRPGRAWPGRPPTSLPRPAFARAPRSRWTRRRRRAKLAQSSRRASMQGLMQQQPLLISSILRHAARHHAGRRGRLEDRPTARIHRTTYAAAGSARPPARPRPRPRSASARRTASARLAWNGHRHLEVYYAAPGMGAICHTINPRLHPDDIAYIINHAGDAVLFADTSFAALLETIAPRIKRLRARRRADDRRRQHAGARRCPPAWRCTATTT